MFLVYQMHCWMSRMRAGDAATARFPMFLLLTA